MHPSPVPHPVHVAHSTFLALGFVAGLGTPSARAGLTAAGGDWDVAALRREIALAPPPPAGGIMLDLVEGATVHLLPDTAGQGLGLQLRNGNESVSVGGLDLKIGISGGSGTAPTMAGVNLRAGSVFTTANSVQSGDPGNSGALQFWSVSINDPFAPPTLAGGGTATSVGTLSLSTLGIVSGTWTLKLYSPETSLFDPFGDPLALSFGDVILQVGVPEPGVTGTVFGCLLLGMVAGRRTHDPKVGGGGAFTTDRS